MTRRRNATAQNRVVARQLMAEVPAREMTEFPAAKAALHAVATATEADVDAAMDALAAFRRQRERLETRCWHLLGLCILEGSRPPHVAANAGVKERSLSRNVAGTPADWVGHDLVMDPRVRPYPWRIVS